MAHVIVIGGSSKLEEVSRYLAQNDNVVSVISRHKEVLDTYAQAAKSFAGKINLIATESLDPKALKDILGNLVKQFGPVTLVLSWIRSKAKEAFVALAEFLNTSSPVCRFFAIDDANNEDMSDTFQAYDRILYRKIFYRGNKHIQDPTDISSTAFTEGIIKAIREDQKDAVLGES